MSEHPFDKLSLDDGGAVIFTPCPGTRGVALRDSLAQLAQAGASAVITLMPDDEMLRNGIADLPDLCHEMGLRWYHFPIEDDHAPGEAFRRAWQRDGMRALEILGQQGTAAVHCKGGSGRTGLMAAILLLEQGVPYEQAVAEVQRLRPNALQLGVHIDYLAEWGQ